MRMMAGMTTESAAIISAPAIPMKPAASCSRTTNVVKFVLDILIFGSFWIAYNAHATGRTLHEWIGLAFAGALVVHAALNWRWVVSVTVRLFEKLPKMTLLGYVLNALLLLDFFMITYTGMAMSRSVAPMLGLQAIAGHEMRGLHEAYSLGGILLMLAHVALHWKWIMGMLRRRVS